MYARPRDRWSPVPRKPTGPLCSWSGSPMNRSGSADSTVDSVGGLVSVMAMSVQG